VKRWLRAFAILLAFVSSLMVAVVAWAYTWLERPVVTSEAFVEVEVGATPASVIAGLIDDGITPPDPRWPLAVRVLGFDRCLQAGGHTIAADSTPREVLTTLCEPGERPSITVTIPEGLNRWQTADVLAESGLVDREAFVAATGSADRIAEYGLDAPTLEGWLAPETWTFDDPTPLDAVLDRLVTHAMAAQDAAFDGAVIPDGYTRYDVLILASLVEREARVDAERPRIARVFWNRLDRGMRLQTDPTCVYGPDRYRETPSPRWCRREPNAWSTYAHDGLPPTPIASPRPASIEAVLQPSDEPDLLFFVAMQDGTGRHAFAATLAEHEANIERYLR